MVHHHDHHLALPSGWEVLHSGDLLALDDTEPNDATG